MPHINVAEAVRFLKRGERKFTEPSRLVMGEAEFAAEL
jgi:hypothetical protein